MKAIMLLFDTLIRKHLPMYGGQEIETPNMDRLAKRSVRFNQHWVGSAPCIPARRDIFTGRLEFLERSWGPLEPYDVILQEQLKKSNLFTHMVTDHYHYFASSGGQYVQSFDSWDFIRGQESDCWISRAIKQTRAYPGEPDYEKLTSKAGKHGMPADFGVHMSQYEFNKEAFVKYGYPLERTIDGACEWLAQNKGRDDYFLMVECFNPHEPFDVPERYAQAVGKNPEGRDFKWPSYAKVTEPDEAVEKLRLNYLSSVLFTDENLGRLLDVFDRQNVWEDTLVIFTTDHGHMLGEHGYTGKNVMPMFNEISRIPCLIHFPGDESTGDAIDAITQNIDLYPTLMDYFGIRMEHAVHGRSLIPLVKKEKGRIRNHALFGVFGANVNMTDGKHVYMRAHQNRDNKPLYNYTASPYSYVHGMSDEERSKIVTGQFLRQTGMQVYKIPVERIWFHEKFLEYCGENRLYDIEKDERQDQNLAGGNLECEMIGHLISEMKKYDAPIEQYLRLGLA
jgi:arylsulfatase A-like enzyme